MTIASTPAENVAADPGVSPVYVVLAVILGLLTLAWLVVAARSRRVGRPIPPHARRVHRGGFLGGVGGFGGGDGGGGGGGDGGC